MVGVDSHAALLIQILIAASRQARRSSCIRQTRQFKASFRIEIEPHFQPNGELRRLTRFPEKVHSDGAYASLRR